MSQIVGTILAYDEMLLFGSEVMCLSTHQLKQLLLYEIPASLFFYHESVAAKYVIFPGILFLVINF